MSQKVCFVFMFDGQKVGQSWMMGQSIKSTHKLLIIRAIGHLAVSARPLFVTTSILKASVRNSNGKSITFPAVYNFVHFILAVMGPKCHPVFNILKIPDSCFYAMIAKLCIRLNRITHDIPNPDHSETEAIMLTLFSLRELASTQAVESQFSSRLNLGKWVPVDFGRISYKA